MIVLVVLVRVTLDLAIPVDLASRPDRLTNPPALVSMPFFWRGGEQALLGRDVGKGSGSIKDADKVPRDMNRWRTFRRRNGGKEGRTGGSG